MALEVLQELQDAHRGTVGVAHDHGDLPYPGPPRRHQATATRDHDVAATGPPGAMSTLMTSIPTLFFPPRRRPPHCRVESTPGVFDSTKRVYAIDVGPRPQSRARAPAYTAIHWHVFPAAIASHVANW